MKRKLLTLISIVTLLVLHVNAENRYWVGGTGSWNNSQNWSTVSGGAGGAAIPTTNDDVFFDQNSFQKTNQVVQVLAIAYCHSINFNAISDKVILGGTEKSKLYISGNFSLSNNLINGFKGQLIFTSSAANTQISMYSSKLEGKMIFDGQGSWVLETDLTGSSNSEIIVQKGNFLTNNKTINVNKFITNGNAAKGIDLGTSEVVIATLWDLSSASNLTFSGVNSKLTFEDEITTQNYRAGGFNYGPIYTRANCSPSGDACGTFTISMTGTNVICNGQSNGTATVSAVGGTGSFSYFWLTPPVNGQTTTTVTGLPAGTYSVRVTDLGSGLICFCNIPIGAPASLVPFELWTVQPTCNGVCNGSGGVTQIGGTSPFTYAWTGGGGTNDTALNLCAGTYTVTVSDFNLCTATATVTINQPSTLISPGSHTNITCNGDNDGTASVVASGGTPNYSYNWTNNPTTGQGTNAISNLIPGTYVCTVTDSKGCTSTYSATIIEPAVLTATGSQTNVSCGGVCDGTAKVVITGGTSTYDYVWSNPPGFSTTTNTASLADSVSALCDGSYTVTVTDANGCTASASYTITEPAVLTVSIDSGNVSCFNVCDGWAEATPAGGSGPYSFVWGPGTPTGFATDSIYNLCDGTYSVTVTDNNGCTVTASVIIEEPTLLTASILSSNISCNALCDGTATVTPAGGTPNYTYVWAGPAGFAGQGTTTLTAMCSGTYTVTVTDDNGCTATATCTIIEPGALTATMTFSNASCGGACDGTATVTAGSGTSPYTYSWAGPIGFTGQGTNALTTMCAGTYTVTVTDFNLCTKTATVTITQPVALTVTLNSTAIACNNQCTSTLSTVVVGGTPTYTYAWSVPGNTASLTNQCAGSYTVTVTDFNNCTGSATVTVTQPTPLSLSTVSTNITCNGDCDGTVGALAGSGTPPYSYSWNPPGGVTPASLNNLCAGTYTLTVSDFNGCTILDTITITEPAVLVANPTVVQNVSCSGGTNGSATAAPTGGTGAYTYDWTPNPVTGDGTNTITGLSAGAYSVLVTDANLCTSSQSVTVTQPSVLTATIIGSTSSCNICNGTATVAGAGGTPGYTYSWAPTFPVQTTPTATGLCPGVTYTVTIRDQNNCSATATVTIVQAVTIIITTNNTTLSCNGSCNGIITANANGGNPPYTYLWAPGGGGAVGQGTQTYSNLCAGTYTVTVTDQDGCFSTATVTFVNPPVLTVSSSKTDVTCGGVLCDGTGTAIPAGGTPPYTYAWDASAGSQTSQTATGLCAGTYTVICTDANLCTASTTVTITQPSVIDDHEIAVGPTCGATDGFILVVPTGGTPPYTYSWSSMLGTTNPIPGQGTTLINNLAPDIYTLIITDNAGCSFTFQYLLSNLLVPATTISKKDISCHGLCDGTIAVNASGGVPPYTYDWLPGTPSGDGTDSIFALCAGTYTVQVNDSQGCIKFDTTTIIEPAIINHNAVVVNESCGGSCNGSITTTVSGGVPPYIYTWAGVPGNPTTSSVSGLCAGTYTLTVTDSNGCVTAAIPYTITSPPTLTVSLSSTNVLCNGANNGTALATVGGGTGAITYVWSHGPQYVLPNVAGLTPGQYIVTVTDANGCTAADTITITEPAALTATTSQVNISCFGSCNGQASVLAAGGTGPYAYDWNSGFSTNDTITSLCVGLYTAIITDFNGCSVTASAVNITTSPKILPNVTSTAPNCNGSCDGTALAAPTGGTGSTYTYLWTGGPGGTTAGINSLCAGTYKVEVTDSLGCMVDTTFTLADPSILIASATATSPSCANGCDGTLLATPVGGTPGYTYSWSPGIAATTASVSNLCPNNYTLIVTDTNGCADTQVVVLNNTLPIDAVISTTNATCGVANGTASVNPTTGVPPYTYLWGPGAITGGTTNSASQLAAGLYTVQVTDFLGCDSIFTVAINNANGPTGATDTINHVSCYGASTGSAAILSVIGGTPGYSYLWNNGTPGTANDTVLNLAAGNYFCTITDANGCVYNHPVTITEPAQMMPNDTIINATCTNICDGAITVSTTGGTGAYSYLWAPAGYTGQGTTTYSNLCAGTYTLTTTDGNGCVKVDTFVVGQSNPLIAIITSSLINCNGDCNGTAFTTITSGTAPFTYQWNDPLNQTNDTASALCAGVYSVTITDLIGCVSTFTDTVNQKPALSPNPTITNATCGLCDGQAVLATTGGTSPYTYVWSNSDVTATADSLCSGLYTVSITDSVGCTTNASIIINNTNGPTGVTVTTTNVVCNSACNGAVTGVAPVGGTAPYTYLWIHNGSTSATQSNLCAGTYYLQITDSLGCSYLDSVIITEPAPILANQIVVAPTCNTSNGSIVIVPSGGSGTYTYAWTGGTATGNTNDTLLNLAAGVYTVVITDNAGCSQTIVIPLNSQSGPTLTASATKTTCYGSCNGTATVVATGGTPGYTYLWNAGGTPTASTTTALCAGTYFVTVTDAAGCISNISATVMQPDSITFSLPSVSEPLCFGDANGSITIIPVGGTLPYSYAWTGTAGTGSTVNNLGVGVYVVTVTDGNGCTATDSIQLSQPAVLALTNVATNPTCNSVANGAINITVTGGTPSYGYAWSNGSTATTEDITGVLPGTYIITVTDANGCVVKDTIVLTATTFVLAVAGPDTSFCQPGPILLDASASTNGVNYQWFLISTPSNISAGTNDSVYVAPPTGANTYYVLVDNGLGCTDTDTLIVNSYPTPTVDAGLDITIYPGTSTTIGGSPTGPVGSSYLWNPLPGLDNSTIANPIASPDVTTTYTVVVTSGNGCTASDSVTVTISPQIVTVNGITPNGDGVNDEWIIPNIEQYPNCVVEVYNRWGELLFQSPGYKEHWKGTFKGKPLPVGTYYYVINLNDPLFPDPYTGPITIMR